MRFQHYLSPTDLKEWQFNLREEIHLVAECGLDVLDYAWSGVPVETSFSSYRDTVKNDKSSRMSIDLKGARHFLQ